MKLEALLSSDNELPKDLFLYSPAETKRITSENIDAVFKKSKDEIRNLHLIEWDVGGGNIHR